LDKLFKSKYAGYKKVDEEELLKDYTPKQREEMNLFCQKKLDAMKSIWAENDAISK
jgi:hypothetical protein